MRSGEPQVSVVLPTKDRLDSLPAALDSVLGQTAADLECIVVDDGSSDDTVAWVATLDDPRVVLVETEGGLGPSAARNRGITRARGRYVAFQDSDDVWLPGKVEAQLAAFARHREAAVCFTAMFIDEGGERRVECADLGTSAFDRLLAYAGPITTPGIMVDRSLVGGELRFDEAMPAMVERELMLRLARTHSVVCVPEPMYVRTIHHGPRVTDPARQIVGRHRILDAFADDLATRPKCEAIHHWRLAAAHRSVGDLDAASGAVRRAAALDPKVRFRALALAASVGPRALTTLWATLDAGDAVRDRVLR